MNALLTALISKNAGLSFPCHFDEAPANAVYPYGVFLIITDVADKTFTEEFGDDIIQYSLFSNSKSAVEITGMFSETKTLLDECKLTISGQTLLRMHYQHMVAMKEEVGGKTVKHWAMDFGLLREIT